MLPTAIHARGDGPLVMVGFGSIGKGTLPRIHALARFSATIAAREAAM
jgi:homospermidine synthase